jgi:hypothetical protein
MMSSAPRSASPTPTAYVLRGASRTAANGQDEQFLYIAEYQRLTRFWGPEDSPSFDKPKVKSRILLMGDEALPGRVD